jgi:1-aminocyclopropane-1-carboxylate deaminase/D-cysteine desulfhydrase-like pyridoxal-dependent ACC family enzyme
VTPLSNPLPVSPVQACKIYGKNCLIKRDDLLGPINGNKARKLYSLVSTNADSIKEIISCGGNQSNLMYSLAILAASKKWKFKYYTTPAPKWLKESPTGNFKSAIDFGMDYFELSANELNTYAKSQASDDSVFIPQGGHFPMAEEGLKLLADETRKQLQSLGNPEVDILLSSGTGTTAFYLGRHLPEFTIATFACVSGVDYLRQQMSELGEIPQNILFLEAENQIPFGQTSLELSNTYYELLDQDLEFDLIYDCSFWTFIKNKWKNNLPLYPGQKHIFFIHSGGLHGNPSQLDRYKRKYPFIRTWRTF